MHFHSILMLAATGVVAAFIPIVAVGTWLQRLGRLDPSRPRLDFRFWGRGLAAACSSGAGAVHLAVFPAHAAELPAGIFFVGLGVFQLVWAIGVLRRPLHGRIVAGLVVNVATLGTWLWSRTLGFPLGAEAGLVEPVGYADALATLLEGILLAILALWSWEPRKTWASRLRVNEVDAFVGTWLWISAVSIFTLVAIFLGPAH